MPANIIQTHNRFEPLRVEDQIKRNGSNPNGNSVVTGHRTSSLSSKIRTQNTDFINSSNHHDHSQPNCQKKVIIGGILLLRANAQKNRANRGHSLKPNPPSFLVYNKVLRSL